MTAVWAWITANWPELLALWIATAFAAALLIGGVIQARNRQVPEEDDQP